MWDYRLGLYILTVRKTVLTLYKLSSPAAPGAGAFGRLPATLIVPNGPFYIFLNCQGSKQPVRFELHVGLEKGS
jgi:hypothetical protein